jgi:hypothetical protein
MEKYEAKFVMMEITEEEMAMIMSKRAKDEKERKRQSYIAELNDTLTRLNSVGFVLATSGCQRITGFKAWSDQHGEWIEAIRK